MRLSADQAKAIGITIEPNGRGKITKPAAGSSRKATRAAKRQSKNALDPQQVIFDALKQRLPHDEIIWEQKNLIPGRKFRADIFLPASRLSIEMDGFQFHRSKDAFQADRKRQNLFVEHEFNVLRYFAAQVFNDLDEVISQIERVHLARKAKLSKFE